MITYLVIHNGDVNKSYKCNTTHTSVPYIRVNEKNYLDLTTETTTGLQLKYKQKTGSSYSSYNTQIFTSESIQTTLTSGYTAENSNSYTSSTYTQSSSISDTLITTSKSKVTFKNRVYIPVQSQSTTVSTTRSSLYTETTGYSGRSTYDTTTYTTTGYTGASWWSENHISTTGYSAYSTSTRTTGTGYRSTTSYVNSSTEKKSIYTQVMTSLERYGKTTEHFVGGTTYAGNRYSTSSWKFIGGGTKSSFSSKPAGSYPLNDYRTGSDCYLWVHLTSIGQTTTQQGSYTQNDTRTLYTYSYSWTTLSGWNNGTSFPQQSGTTWERREGTYTYSWTATYTYSLTRTAAVDTYTQWTETTTSVDDGYRASRSSTMVSTKNSYTITSRYSTTDYKDWYPDFTAYSTGTSRHYNYYTSTAIPSNYNGITELTQGYTTRYSSLASSSIPGQLSSTTALTSSGTKTSSSMKWSSAPGILVSVTDLTVTSSRTSLTNRTSSTDL